ncbi:MAG: hypothetical protein K2O02_00730 [Lachnospiraceae bacterium]|nr:hypothetical protein [Lachnospiraceae bacterium]
MSTTDRRTWSVRVPKSTYNVTFNRLNSNQTAQWNSWSAGGRDGYNTYYVYGHEYGFWGGSRDIEEGFRAGDVIYLDYYEFSGWKQADARFYINFTDASKEENGGSDISISGGDKTKYSPIGLTNEIEEDVFTYTVTEEEAGSTELRFWRGNTDTLWNCSVTLSYQEYQAGNNCVKIQGWEDTGYVCPYVPRKHKTQIDSLELRLTGNRKVNRKLTLDLNVTGETERLLTDQTVISVQKMGVGNETENGAEEEYVRFDDTTALWNHRELLFKEAGTYRITAVVTDGEEEFQTETVVTVAADEAPTAGFSFDREDSVYTRDKNGTAVITITDKSLSEVGDTIISRMYDIYYDADNDGLFSEEEMLKSIQVPSSDLKEMETVLHLSSVGNYKVVQTVREHFEDTIPSLIEESDYLSGNTRELPENYTTFTITNQAPSSSMSMEKSKIADIIFTVGNVDSSCLEQYAAAGERAREILKEQGIQAEVSTVSTSALTAQDTFAWKEYDHYNYQDTYLPAMPKHILYEENDIIMMGYSVKPIKDFLYVADEDGSRKVFDFDLQRDSTNWHSMEGGGFLFNTMVSEEENYIQGYCILVTQSGLQLVQINKTNLDKFRNGTYNYVSQTGKLLQTFRISNLYAEHHFKIIVDNHTVTVFDGDTLVINEFVLPEHEEKAYGYGPIISHKNHACEQQSYFTFKNIVMQTIRGESLSDVVAGHNWTPGTNHYVIHFSQTAVPEFMDTDRMADTAAALLGKDVRFYGLGNDITMEEYNGLLNVMDGKGTAIRVGDSEQSGEEPTLSVSEAAEEILSAIIADVKSKDYSIGYTLASDEQVVYTGTYYDPEGDPAGEQEWNYVYDASVFGESTEEEGEVRHIQTVVPITMFEQTGAYEISLRVSDDPTGGNPALSSYILWSDLDDYKKLVLSQRRPQAVVSATVMESADNKDICTVNVSYNAWDEDHPSDSRRGIREEKFYYKEIHDTAWMEGKMPASVPAGTTWLVMYLATDIEGTVSRPALCTVKTAEARTFREPEDNTPPEVLLSVTALETEPGKSFYIEASAADDYGITDFTVCINGEKFADTYGRFEYTPQKTGELEITATAVDICGNTTTEMKKVTVLDKSDVTPPVIEITSPKNGAITGKTDIIGSITDDKELKSYVITQKFCTASEKEDSDVEQKETVLAEGNGEIRNGVLASFDTEGLACGVYEIKITAKDAAGLETVFRLFLTVEEDNSADRIPPKAEISDIRLNKAEDKSADSIIILGTAADETALSGYELRLYPAEKSQEEAKPVAAGTAAVENDVLGEILTADLESGSYRLLLVVTDAAGNETITGAGFDYVKGTSEEETEQPEIVQNTDTTAPVISAVLTAVIEKEGLKLGLAGTITDENLKSYRVTTWKEKSEVTDSDMVCMAEGSENIVDGTIGEYIWKDYSAGQYVVRVEAEDMAGNYRRTDYGVTVTENKTVQGDYQGDKTEDGDGEGDSEQGGKISLLLSTTLANVGDTIQAYVTYPVGAEQVTLTSDGREIAINGRTAAVTGTKAGETELVFSAVVKGELQTVTERVRFLDTGDRIHPKAVLLTPEIDSVVKEKTEITGTAWDETSLAYYKLEYRMEGSDNYTEIVTSNEPVKEGILGSLDATKLLNGRYALRLTVVDNGGNRVWVERDINVEGNLKIGAMSLSFTDISSNVAGVPLTVIRSYDSRNKRSGDFGFGWSLGLQSVTLSEASDITQGYDMIQVGEKLSTGYYMTQTQCHDVTITYGDGTSDRFRLKLSPERQALVPIYEVAISFECVTNPKLTLELDGDNHAMVQGGQLLFEDETMFNSHSYILTREDGTKLYLDEKYGLKKLEDSNGNILTISRNAFTHSDGTGVVFTRDIQGRITKAEERKTLKNGEKTVIHSAEYGYDSRGNLVSVTDDAGRTVSFTYDEEHNLIDIIDPSGIAMARNEYDEEGRLIAVIDAEGNRIEYTHDIEGRTEAVRDRLGNVTVYTYDENGNIIKTVDALGTVTANTFDGQNNLLSQTDGLGNVTRYGYDEKNNVTSLITPDGTTAELGYNSFNMVSSISLSDKTVLTMNYDTKGNLTSLTDSMENTTELAYDKEGRLTGLADSIGEIRTLTYDSEGNLLSITDGVGAETRYTYTTDGVCTGVTVKRTEADGTTREYTSNYMYDMAGNVTSSISNTGAVTNYEYDYRNNMTATVSPDGQRTEYIYDSQSNLIRISYSDGTMEQFTYDANGNVLTATSRIGLTSQMTYDKLNRLIKKAYADGTEEHYSYDANGNVLTYTSASGAVTTYTYDNRNRNISVTDTYGNQTTFEYDTASRLIKTTDALGNVFQYTYDSNGNQTGIIYPDKTVKYTVYDARGRIESESDQNGNITTYTYDSADHLIAVKDAMGGTYSYTYNETGNLTTVTDAAGNTITYTYDGEGRLNTVTNPLMKTAFYEYDITGKITLYTDYAGSSTEYIYDTFGRLIKTSDKDGDIVYTHDHLGRLIKVTDKNGNINYSYDTFGRLKSKDTYGYGTIGYGYDTAGRLYKTSVYVNGTIAGTTTYEYDRMDRLVRVIDHNGRAVTYEYDAIGNRTVLKYEDGIHIIYQYDSCSRLTNQKVTDKDSNVLMTYSYQYGRAGERTKSIETKRNSASDDSVAVTIMEYRYDNLLRLTEETISYVNEVPLGLANNSRLSDWIKDNNKLAVNLEASYDGIIQNIYTYDAVSNRICKKTLVTGTITGISKDVTEGVTEYTYNALNQLVYENMEGITVSYSYDDNGNLISQHGDKEDKTYTYNGENRLITASVSNGNNVTIESYTYDYEGNRITKKTNEEEEIWYLNDTFGELTQIALELSKDIGNSTQEENVYSVKKYYTRGVDLLGVDILEENNYTYKRKQYIMDGHGSVTALAESDEKCTAITDTYTYDAYGSLLEHTGDTDNEYLYTGEQYNESTGLYYLRARYMNPQTGTFISMDSYAGTLDSPVSLHKYLYANANPVMYSDPTGYFSLSELSVAQAVNRVLDTGRMAVNLHNVMTWANITITVYDTANQIRFFLTNGDNLLGVVYAIARGMIIQGAISCFSSVVLGKAAGTVLKVIGVTTSASSFIEAVKSGDAEKIIMETMRLVVSVYALSCQCFTGDTLVSTVEGEKRIDEIEIGDYVWSYNTETGKKDKGKVINVSVTETDTLVYVRTSNEEEICTTMYHPFYVKSVEGMDREAYNGEWKAASKLVKGDVLVTRDGQIVRTEEIRIEKLAEKIRVYNLEIEGLHTYYVGADELLVHNWCKRDLSETSELQSSDFQDLKSSGSANAGRTGSNRPYYGAPNSYKSSSSGEHVFIYDSNGKLLFDLSKKRVKAFKINIDPKGNEHFQEYKLRGEVPDFMKKMFGW